jgi:ABC-2 type transport system ATP-binding protein
VTVHILGPHFVRSCESGCVRELLSLGQFASLPSEPVNHLDAKSSANASAGNWVVETEELTCRFGTFVAVDKLSIRVAKGASFGLLGPNGAGKSTTMKMLATLFPPTSGHARVAGYDVVAQAQAVRRHIGYVPQVLSADGALTGTENLLLSARLYGISSADRKRLVMEALEFMGLQEFAGRLVRSYSGGMIRRLELAQAMLHRPVLLFLDEPTIGLDPLARHAVWDRLLEMRDGLGTTILVTTHDMDEADHLCQELAIMHLGKIAVRGTPAHLKAEIGPDATLDDVFSRHSGGEVLQGERYENTRQTRIAVSRRH